jgi:2-keto-4-pentenoate hydratase/2-oxohepta-3-ene-1,7-dioic acid hydratase in catechol pathway
MPDLAPSKIVCVGRNYAGHARELGNEVPKEPLLFLKPPSSLIRSGESIVLPTVSNQVEYEGEIGVVVGKRLRKVSPEVARDAITNLCAANDVTARDLQKSDVQFTRAKGFDTFCAVGELGPIPDELGSLRVRTLVNGVVRQDGSASDMVFDIPTLVSFISGVMTLEPGDLILTGTPEGVGTLSSGDMVEVEVVGVSRVGNPVTSDH